MAFFEAAGRRLRSYGLVTRDTYTRCVSSLLYNIEIRCCCAANIHCVRFSVSCTVRRNSLTTKNSHKKNRIWETLGKCLV